MSETILDTADTADAPAIPVFALAASELDVFLEGAPAPVQAQARIADFKAKAGQVVVVPDAQGAPERVLFGLGAEPNAMALRGLPSKLPAGIYRIAQAP